MCVCSGCSQVAECLQLAELVDWAVSNRGMAKIRTSEFSKRNPAPHPQARCDERPSSGIRIVGDRRALLLDNQLRGQVGRSCELASQDAAMGMTSAVRAHPCPLR